ncbi:MAG: DUF502 domain-containing protein, partial [Tepidisphaeraceae bacterium]
MKSGRGFSEDFRTFFLRGLAAVLPTLITLWLLVWAWNFLWVYLGQYILVAMSLVVESAFRVSPRIPFAPGQFLATHLPPWASQLIGVMLAVVLVYVVGLFVGHFIGRAAWRMIEVAVMRIPLVRAIYPAVKQVTDFLLADRKESNHFAGSRVVAVRPHEGFIWSFGLVTGSGLAPLV